MRQVRFEWDEKKDAANQLKHKVSFSLGQEAFFDTRRVIARDLKHSGSEERYFCMGKVGDAILTVRFTLREDVIRIIGAGYWRKGREVYEKENSLYR